MTLDRDEWLNDVEARTERWRFLRASELERRGEIFSESPALDSGDVVGSVDSVDVGVGLGINIWHAQRAEATRERFVRVKECNRRARVTSCECGGHKPTRVPLTCDHWRLCYPCQRRKMHRNQARFALGRKGILRERGADTANHTRGGRWGEKLLTFTLPHIDIASDIAALIATWPRFRQRLARYLKANGSVHWDDVRYWRALEVAGEGATHAHFHVWMLLPFVPQEVLAQMWTDALPSQYRALLEGVAVVDIRAARGDVGRELAKYIVKDFVSRDQRISAEDFAKVYYALDNVRVVATSTHWLPPSPSKCWCDFCGAHLYVTFRDVHELDALSTGPPAQA